jgi:hypothetical protein
MQCKKLTFFQSASRRWHISSCRAALRPYVPSLEELQKLCTGRGHEKCRIYNRANLEETSVSSEATMRTVLCEKADFLSRKNNCFLTQS